LDGVQARNPKNIKFNNGNVPYELLIQPNTLISILGKYEPETIKEIEPKKCDLMDVLNTSECISKFHTYLHFCNFIVILLNLS